MKENPWHRLPPEPDFVLPEDKDEVLKFNSRASQKHALDLTLIPEPFVGRPDAPVILLGNNPGFKNLDAVEYKRKPKFIRMMRDNLLHRLLQDFPFLYLSPDLPDSGAGKKWWERKLKSLLSRFGRSLLAQRIFAIEFFPYHSHKYGFRKRPIPSRNYACDLVRDAMARDSVIVLTRGKNRWFWSVPELEKYPRLVKLAEVQRAPISQRNCGEGGYELIVSAIKGSR